MKHHKYCAIFAMSASVLLCNGFVGKSYAEDLTTISGIWALDRAACKLSTPDYDDRLRISRDGKNASAEDQCAARNIRNHGSSIAFKNSCKSEGATHTTNVRIQIVSASEIKWIEGRALAVNYVRCRESQQSEKSISTAVARNTKFESGSFSLSSHGYSATITSLTGSDTSNAIMLGAVTREDAAEECERNSPGGNGLKPTAMQSCVEKTLAQTAGKVFRSTADCKSQTISPSFGGLYRIVGRDETDSLRIYDAKGREVGYSSAAGTPSIEDQFKHMCPRTSANIKGKA